VTTSGKNSTKRFLKTKTIEASRILSANLFEQTLKIVITVGQNFSNFSLWS